jgi:2-isopropylmalate synthase
MSGPRPFAHKAGLHASAILKNPATYEHVDPALVGNDRIIPMSNQAGQSNLRARLAIGRDRVGPKDPALAAHPGSGQGARGSGLCL